MVEASIGKISPDSIEKLSTSAGGSLASSKMSSEVELSWSWSETNVSLLSHSSEEMSEEDPNSVRSWALVFDSIEDSELFAVMIGVSSLEAEESMIGGLLS